MSDERGITSSVRRLAPILSYVLVGAAALLLRVLDLGRFAHTDEVNFWIDRSHRFLDAIQAGDFAATAISTHPGVTTMWLGSAGILLHRWLFAVGVLTEGSFETLLICMRLPVALVHTAAILVGYALLRRLFTPAVALLAALLWATDPFITAFHRILHVDGLTSTFLTLSVLAAAVAMRGGEEVERRRGGEVERRRGEAVERWRGEEAKRRRGEEEAKRRRGEEEAKRRRGKEAERPVSSRLSASRLSVPASRILGASRLSASPPRLPASPPPGWLVLSAVCGALAMMSKSPGLAIVPVVGVLLIASSPHRLIASSLPRLLLWGGVALLTGVLLWPALWADPMRVYRLVHTGVSVEGSTRHVVGNFFLGRPVDVPGPLYYPVVLAIRTTPWTLAGLLLLPVHHFPAAPPRLPAAPPRLPVSPRPRLTVATLAGFAILFIAAMSLFAKQLDRYLIPALPVVNILAAAGLVGAAERLALLVSSRPRLASSLPRLLVVVVGIAALANAAWWHPYGVAYFNQALGGLPMGARTVMLGEGEGLGETAAWLNQQPDITGVVVTSTMESSLQTFLKHGAQAVPEYGTAMDEMTGYMVVYIRHMQRWQNHPPPPYNQFYQRVPPTHAVTIHGIPYALIYQVPRPIAHPVAVNFGAAIQLQGYEVDTSAIRSSGTLSLTVQWKAQAPIADDYTLFVHMFDAAGQRVAQIDVPPAGPHAPTHTWPQHRYLTWVHPLPVPPDLPAGRYRVALGLYDPDTFARLPIARPPPPDAPDDGDNVLFLEPVTLSDE